MDHHQYCRQIAVESGSSIHYSFLFLTAERRRAITALYAFCREIDDGVEECTDAGVARTKLSWWREELSRVYHGQPQHPVALALADIVSPCGIEESELAQIIEGVAMDLEYNAYPDFAALAVYCHRIAGVVGQLSARIFGYRDPRTAEYAEQLGLALQFTHIVRNVGEDARRGRIYLPLHELAEYGVSSQDILDARETPEFSKLIDFQIARAHALYAHALCLLPGAERKAQRPGLVLAAIYRTLLREIEADGAHVLTRRTALTPLRKLWIAWTTWTWGWRSMKG